MASLFSISYAEAAIDATEFGRVIDPIMDHVVKPAIMLLVLFGIVVFVFGVVEMLVKGEDAEARSKGKMHMLWGVVGIFIMLSAWGIIYVISNTIKGI